MTLAFVGDVHFEDHLADRLDDPDPTLDPPSKHLRDADLAMVKQESALTTRGAPTSKELDSTEYSRPILERRGLVVVSTTTPYLWRR